MSGTKVSFGCRVGLSAQGESRRGASGKCEREIPIRGEVRAKDERYRAMAPEYVAEAVLAAKTLLGARSLWLSDAGLVCVLESVGTAEELSDMEGVAERGVS